jgi:trehalose 6-phosphate phosphatase
VKAILSADGRAALDELARGPALLAFDFDGTLAPIVKDRSSAELPAETRRLLRALALMYPCAVISGRSRADVAARLTAIPLLAIVGNHGAEAGRGPIDRSRRARLVAWKRSLEGALDSEPGVEIEDKRFSIAVHYRHAPVRATARHAVLRAAGSLPGVRVFGGHAVVNVVPADAPNKGTALQALVARTGAGPVLYAGDDRTDEDAFRSPYVGVSIRVGRTLRTSARWYLPEQGAIDELLRALIGAKIRLDGVPVTLSGITRAVGT